MDRFAQGLARLATRLAGRGGAAVVYVRGAAAVPLTAVRLSGRDTADQPGQPPLRVSRDARDYSLAVATLTAAGLWPPASGDLIEDQGRAFGVTAPADGPLWEWGEPERVTVRVRTVDRDEAVPAGAVAWADGGPAGWADGTLILGG